MSQIFKRVVDRSLLFAYLDKVCSFNNNQYYVFTLACYKKGVFNQYNTDFCNMLREYYHTSKRKYIDRKPTYSGLCTIIRQICKINNISYRTKIIYDKSTYNICYYIYTAAFM